MVLDQIGDDHNADFSKPGTAQDYGNITHGYHGSVGFMCSILAQSEALKTLKYHWLPKTAWNMRPKIINNIVLSQDVIFHPLISRDPMRGGPAGVVFKAGVRIRLECKNVAGPEAGNLFSWPGQLVNRFGNRAHAVQNPVRSIGGAFYAAGFRFMPSGRLFLGQPEFGNHLLAHGKFLDLAGDGHRKAVNKSDIARDLIMRDLTAAELADFPSGRILAVAQPSAVRGRQ